LKIRNQTGGTNPPHSDPGWDQEQALDLDMVSAMCPKCKLLLVQANSVSGKDLYTAVSEAAKLGAVVISNSYGGSEYSQCGGPGEPSDPAFSAAGHIYVASSGDYGGGLGDCGGPQQPCSLATVVCVGGTHLVRGNTRRGWKESVWNELASNLCTGGCGGTGSGCSIVVKKPSWQFDTGCAMRTESDISAEASVLTPVAVYYSGWTAFGGTSVSAPLVAGIYGRAGNGGAGNGPKNLYSHHTLMFDVTVGSNLYSPVTGPCASGTRYICYARKGVDGPTGFGSPNGLAAF
jgi:subtilase family serine protease